MANCLVTKLKEVVNDVEIPVLGELVFKLRPATTPNPNPEFTVTTAVGPQTVKVLKGHLYVDEECTNPYPSVIEVEGNFHSCRGYTNTEEETIISISNKYNFYNLFAHDRLDLNLEDLYFTDYTTLLLSGNKSISGDIEDLIEHSVDVWVKNSRVIDPAYPVYLQLAGSNARFKGSTDWGSKTWGLTILKDTSNTKVYNIYAAETDQYGYLLPQASQYTRLGATYNYETKVWTYTDLFD